MIQVSKENNEILNSVRISLVEKKSTRATRQVKHAEILFLDHIFLGLREEPSNGSLFDSQTKSDKVQ